MVYSLNKITQSNNFLKLSEKGLEYVGPFLSIEAILAMIIGILFLGYGLYTDSKI